MARLPVHRAIPAIGVTAIGVGFVLAHDVVDPSSNLMVESEATLGAPTPVIEKQSASAAPTTERPIAEPIVPMRDDVVTVTGSLIRTRYGPIQVVITVAAGELVDVVLVSEPDGRQSGQINDGALPDYTEAALTEQSAAIDAVSGATVTWDAYTQSLQSALDLAGLG